MIKMKNSLKEQNITKEFMFDTNVFDELLSEKIDLDLLPKNIKYYITHLQEDEIEAMGESKIEKKKQLLSILNKFDGETIPTEANVLGVSQLGACKLGNGVKIPTEAAVWGVSRWGKSKWGSGVKISIGSDDTTYFEALQNGNPRHVEDALIGDTAIGNNLTLVTNDENFRNKVQKLGGKALSFNEFMEISQVRADVEWGNLLVKEKRVNSLC